MAKNLSRAISYVSTSISIRRLSTATATATKATPKSKLTAVGGWSNKNKRSPESSILYHKLAALGGKTNVDAGETIDEWLKDGKAITNSEVMNFVYELRKYKNYHHAIQLLEWLDKRGRVFSDSDQAIRLDLIAKTKGVVSAENFLMNLPKSSKNRFTYGALLHCYCHERMSEKAMALFEEMKKQNCASTSLVYNSIISLHLKVGEPEKNPPIVQEMKEKNIKPDVHTCSLLMNSYGLMNDIGGAESIIGEMKKDGVKPDYGTYANLASIYVKAGQLDKANSTLKEIEKRNGLDRKAYQILMGLYSHASNKLGVDRVWDSLKVAHPKVTNICYLARLQALHRLGDLDGLKKCYEEWESGCSTYDIRLANVLIEYYLGHDMIKEAEALRDAAVSRRGTPNFKTVEMFLNSYLKNHQFYLALMCLETAPSKMNKNEWKPSQDVVQTFLKYFEEEKDVDGAEKLFKNLKRFSSVDSNVYDSLMRTYIAAGIREPQMLKRMEEDGIEISSSSRKLIAKVSSEQTMLDRGLKWVGYLR